MLPLADTLLPLLLVILLFLPVVRKFYWRKPATVKGEENCVLVGGNSSHCLENRGFPRL